MKKLILSFLVALTAFAAKAQPSWKQVNGYWQYVDIRATKEMRPPIDTSNSSADNGSIATIGSSVFVKISGQWIAITGSGGGGVWGSIAGNINNQNDLINLLNQKVNVHDTANMLSAYIRSVLSVKYTDTGSMLSAYLRSVLGVKYTDTASMLSAYLRAAQFTKANIGLGNVVNNLQVINAGGATSVAVMPYASIPSVTGGPTLIFTSDTLVWLYNNGTAYVRGAGGTGGGGGGSADSTTFLTRYRASVTYVPLSNYTQHAIDSLIGFTPYSALNPSGFISGNQSITFTAGGDVSGTATGSTALSPGLTVTGLLGKTLGSLATGKLSYSTSTNSWSFDNTRYLTGADTTNFAHMILASTHFFIGNTSGVAVDAGGDFTWNESTLTHCLGCSVSTNNAVLQGAGATGKFTIQSGGGPVVEAGDSVTVNAQAGSILLQNTGVTQVQVGSTTTTFLNHAQGITESNLDSSKYFMTTQWFWQNGIPTVWNRNHTITGNSDTLKISQGIIQYLYSGQPTINVGLGQINSVANNGNTFRMLQSTGTALSNSPIQFQYGAKNTIAFNADTIAFWSDGSGVATYFYSNGNAKFGNNVNAAGYYYQSGDTAATRAYARSIATAGFDSASSQGGGFHTLNYLQGYFDVRYRKTWLDSLYNGLVNDTTPINHTASTIWDLYTSNSGKTLNDKGWRSSSAILFSTNSDSSNTATIAASGISAGPYGDATHVPVITFGADGRATVATVVAITGGGGSGTTNLTLHKYAAYDSILSSTGTGVEVDTATSGLAGLMSNYGFAVTHHTFRFQKALCTTCDSLMYAHLGANADTAFGKGITWAWGIIHSSTQDSLTIGADSNAIKTMIAGDYQYTQSVAYSGGIVKLVNDNAAPGNNYYYATNNSGVKGWIPIPAALVVYYQVIQSATTAKTQRNALNFGSEFSLVDSSAGNSTNVYVNTIQQSKITGLPAALAALAPLASPTFTGTPVVPTATAGTNTTQAASTAFVTTALASYAPLASPTFTGTPAVPTATSGTNTTQAASTAFVTTALASYATLASPTFTGTPAVPTASTATSTTQAASTAFVHAAVNALVLYNQTVQRAGASITQEPRLNFSTEFTAVDNSGNTSSDIGINTIAQAKVTGLAASLAALAPLASPTFTGTVTIPTATAGSNTTVAANTAWVTTAIAGLAPLASPTFTGTPAVPTAANGTNTTQAASTAYVLNMIAQNPSFYNSDGALTANRNVSILGYTLDFYSNGIGSGGVTFQVPVQFGQGVSLLETDIITPNTSYTATQGDNNIVVTSGITAAGTITLPTTTSGSFPTGSQAKMLMLTNNSAYNWTLTNGTVKSAGVTITTLPSHTACIILWDQNESDWYVVASNGPNFNATTSSPWQNVTSAGTTAIIARYVAVDPSTSQTITLTLPTSPSDGQLEDIYIGNGIGSAGSTLTVSTSGSTNGITYQGSNGVTTIGGSFYNRGSHFSGIYSAYNASWYFTSQTY